MALGRSRPRSISLLAWFAVLPKFVELVDDGVKALRDGRISENERKTITDDFWALLMAAKDAD